MLHALLLCHCTCCARLHAPGRGDCAGLGACGCRAIRAGSNAAWLGARTHLPPALYCLPLACRVEGVGWGVAHPALSPPEAGAATSSRLLPSCVLRSNAQLACGGLAERGTAGCPQRSHPPVCPLSACLQGNAAGGGNRTSGGGNTTAAAATLLFSFFPDGASVPTADQTIGYRLLR